MGTVALFHIYTDPFGESRNKLYSGKRAVPHSMLKDAVRLPSNCGREISFAAPDTGMPPTVADFLLASLKPVQAIKNIYLHTLPRIRGWEDVIFLHQPINFLVNLVGVTGELISKTVGVAFSQPFHQLWQQANNKNNGWGARIGAGLASVLVGLPLLVAVAWPSFIVGNLISYIRKLSDGLSNFASSVVSMFSERYGEKYSPITEPLKTIGKNTVLLLGGGVPFVSGLFSYAIIKTRDFFGIGKESVSQGTSRQSTAIAMTRLNIDKTKSRTSHISPSASLSLMPGMSSHAPPPAPAPTMVPTPERSEADHQSEHARYYGPSQKKYKLGANPVSVDEVSVNVGEEAARRNTKSH